MFKDSSLLWVCGTAPRCSRCSARPAAAPGSPAPGCWAGGRIALFVGGFAGLILTPARCSRSPALADPGRLLALRAHRDAAGAAPPHRGLSSSHHGGPPGRWPGGPPYVQPASGRLPPLSARSRPRLGGGRATPSRRPRSGPGRHSADASSGQSSGIQRGTSSSSAARPAAPTSSSTTHHEISASAPGFSGGSM